MRGSVLGVGCGIVASVCWFGQRRNRKKASWGSRSVTVTLSLGLKKIDFICTYLFVNRCNSSGF